MSAGIPEKAAVKAEVAANPNLTYKYNDETKTAEVSSADKSYAGTIEIPSVVKHNNTDYTVTKIGINCFGYCPNMTGVTIPNTVTTIANQAFTYCTGLKSIDIPASVTEIQGSAFSECTGLTSVVIPNSVTKLGILVFQNCTGLRNLTLPNAMTSLPTGTFQGCTSLESLTIPASVTTLAPDAIQGCTGLTSLNVDPENPEYASNDNIIYSKDKTTLVVAAGSLKNVNIPDGVTTIGKYAFSKSHLASIAIPNSVTAIEASAFMDCSSLAAANLPEYVTTIGQFAFSGCSSLTGVTLPNSVTSIGSYLFSDCTSLTAITFSSSLKSIEANMFDGCTGLTQIEIPNTITKIGNDAFNRCKNLASVTIPNSVTEIGDNAFSNCASLTSITLPKSLKKIGKQSFYTSGLTCAVIPASVTSIGNAAFSQCALDWIILSKDFGSWNNICLQSNKFTCKAVFIKDKDLAAAQGSFSGRELQPLSGFVQVADTMAYPSAVAFKMAPNPLVGNQYADIIKSVEMGNQAITPDDDGNYVAKGLAPKTPYVLKVTFQPTGSADVFTAEKNVATTSFAVLSGEAGQTTAKVKVALIDDPYGEVPAEYGVNGQKADETGIVAISGLQPNAEQALVPYIKMADGTTYYGDAFTVTTAALAPQITVLSSSPTTIFLEGTHADGDAAIHAAGFVDYDSEDNTHLDLNGLDPEKALTFVYFVRMEDGYEERDTLSLTPPALEWETLPAESLTNTTATISAKTNIVAGETGTGLEWRQSDAPESEPSTQELCPVIEGLLTKPIESLMAGTAYKFRPYYTSASGTTYYGEWQTFTTTDMTDGIGSIGSGTAENAVGLEYYSADGRRIAKLQKGLNIVRYSDGSVRKVLVK